MSTGRSPWWSIVLMMVGIVFCIYAVTIPFHPLSKQSENNQYIMESGRPSPAVIQSVKKTMQVDPEKPGSEPTLMETANVSFKVDGNVFEFNTMRPVSMEAWERDTPVEVFYLPEDPRESVLNEKGIPGTEDIRVKQFLFFGPGSVVFLMGIIFFLRKNNHL